MEQKLLTKSVLCATEQGYKAELRDYISRGVVGVVDEEGSTPLMYAAANGREEVVRLLLDEKTISSNKLELNTDIKYIDHQNIYGWTALMQAACYGHLNVVISLLQRGANVHLCNNWGASALVGASQGGFYGVVHKLLNEGAEPNPHEVGVASLTPLMAATQCGHVEIVRELLRRGADVKSCVRGTQWTALMLAVLNNQIPVMELLLQHGADKTSTDVNGHTAAELAFALGHTDIVELLTGKKLRECSEGEFFEMIRSGAVDKVSNVLKTHKELVNSHDKDGATPLMLAANRGNIKMIELLLERGADVNTTDNKYGWTALMLATHQRKYEVVELLGKKGADVNVRGKSGSTAFDVANMISDIKMIRIVANISVEQIQRQGPPEATPPLAIPARSGGEQALRQHINTPRIDTANTKVNMANSEMSVPNTEVGVANTEVGVTNTEVGVTKDVQFVDLTELKRKLDKAYRTPTPSINVGGDKAVTMDMVSVEGRFPAKRTETSSLPRRLATPTSLSSSDISTPSSSGYSSPRTSDPFNDKPLNTIGIKKPQNLLLKNTRPQHSVKTSPVTKSPSRRPSNPSPLLPKLNLTPKLGSPSTSSLRGRLKGPPPFRTEDLYRRRAETAPSRPTKKLSVPRAPSGLDLKSALEKDSLGHLYPIFTEQEITMVELLTLTESDLRELGVGGEDTGRVLSLIHKIKHMSSPHTPQSPAMFTFLS